MKNLETLFNESQFKVEIIGDTEGTFEFFKTYEAAKECEMFADFDYRMENERSGRVQIHKRTNDNFSDFETFFNDNKETFEDDLFAYIDWFENNNEVLDFQTK